ncbi:MAG: hypothetical protein KGN02_09650 [bacterium]|nr:hypothetical protein [bacterium]
MLDGSHAGFQAAVDATATVTANAALAGGVSQASVQITNANFTQPPIASNSAVLAPAIPGWTLSGGFVLINGNDGADPTVPAGYQALGGFTAGASAQTTLTGLTVGNTYSVSYLAAVNGNPASHIQVLANGVDITNGTITPPGTYTQFTTNTFVASSTSVTLAFNNIQAGGNAQFTGVTLNAVGTGSAGINSNFLVASISAANANFQTTIGTQAYNAAGTYATVDGSIELQVINTGVSIAVQETFINSATGAVSVDANLYGAYGVASDFDNVAVTIGGISNLDVGTTAYVKISQHVAALTNPSNPAFNFQSAANEGDVIQVGIEATNTATLRISNINLALSAGNNPSIGAEDAIGQIDNALERLLNQRAQLGSVIVRLNEDASNDNVAAVNLQASESSIRDLNVGQATTEFTKLQILVQVGTSVLSQSNANAQSVLGLFR